MKASHKLERVSVSFDEDNLVANGGLIAPAMLAQKLGLTRLVDTNTPPPNRLTRH